MEFLATCEQDGILAISRTRQILCHLGQDVALAILDKMVFWPRWKRCIFDNLWDEMEF